MESKHYLEIPFLPNQTVKSIIIDGRVSMTIVNNLKKMGIHIIKTPCCKEVYKAISYHPDILLHPVTGQDIVVAPNVYEELQAAFLQIGLNPIKGSTYLKSNYPYNVAYNVARLSNFAIHNLKYTDNVLLKLLEQQGVEFIHVNQGYSKCSICIVNERAIITADRGIAKAVEKHGIAVLLISPGYISLSGLEYGFIGGISGLVSSNKLAFTGRLTDHPDHERIMKFLDDQNVNSIFLSKNDPVDIGSIIPILQMAS